jgi:hypothetical protein
LDSSTQLDAKTDGASPEGKEAGYPDAVSDGFAPQVPVWEAQPGDVHGCRVDRLANPSQVRVFSWKPCEGIPGCEFAEADPTIGGTLSYLHSVAMHQGSVVAGVVLHQNGYHNRAVMFTDEAGRALDGYRPDPEQTLFTSGVAAVGESRYGVIICNLDDAKQQANCGGVAAGLGTAPEVFSLIPNLVGVPGQAPM